MGHCRSALFSGCLLLAAAWGVTAADAQAIDRDPFSAPPAEERLEAAQRERIAQITSSILLEQVSELETSIADTVERRLVSRVDARLAAFLERNEALVRESSEDLAARLEAFTDDVPGLIEEEIERISGRSVLLDLEPVPAEWSFVACVDERALYRDESGKTFYMDQDALYKDIVDCST